MSDLEKLERKLAVTAAIGWMQNAIDLHARCARQLQERMEQFQDAVDTENGVLPGECSSRASSMDVLSWFVNELSNVQGNLRMDLLPRRSVDLANSKPVKAKVQP